MTNNGILSDLLTSFLSQKWELFKRLLLASGVALVCIFSILSLSPRYTRSRDGYRVFVPSTSATLMNDANTSTKPFDFADYAARCHRNQLDKFGYHRKGNRRQSLKLIASKDFTGCPRRLREARKSKTRTWLLSMPGSGNTWTRHLLQQLTGLYTGSLYHDGVLQENGFPYEGHTRQVVAIKTHSLWAIGAHTDIEINHKTDRLIVLIRNPYFSLLSQFKGSRMHLKHTGNAPIPTNSMEWRMFMERQVSNWQKNTFLSVKSDLEKIIVYYEDLRSDLLPQLMRLANFISDKSLQGFAFCCTLKASEGTQHRKASNQTSEDAYSTEDKMAINAMLAELASSIQTDYPDVATRLLSYVKPLPAIPVDDEH